MGRGEADGRGGRRGAPALHRAEGRRGGPRGRPGVRLRRHGTGVALVSSADSWAVRRPVAVGGPRCWGSSEGARPGWGAPAPGLADGNPFPGPLPPSLGALCLPGSPGTSRAGLGRPGGHPGTAPWGATEAVRTLGRLSPRPTRLRGASAPGGLAQPRGGRPLRAQGQAGLARPQLGRGARGVGAGLRGGPGHGDGGGEVRAAGGVHVGHPVHGQRRGLLSCGERKERDREALPAPRLLSLGVERGLGARPAWDPAPPPPSPSCATGKDSQHRAARNSGVILQLVNAEPRPDPDSLAPACPCDSPAPMLPLNTQPPPPPASPPPPQPLSPGHLAPAHWGANGGCGSGHSQPRARRCFGRQLPRL